MDELMGALTRSTGIVALVLAVLALAWGFFFSSRDTGTKLRPAWWLDLHNWLGGLTLTFTGVHILASWLDSASGIALADVFVPGVSGWAITFGVLATYLFATAVFTSWPKKLKKRPWWRIIHLGSVPATAFAFIHTIQIGSDSAALWFRVAFVVSAAFATYGLGIRVFNLIARQWSSA
jgi:hypothetical protein